MLRKISQFTVNSLQLTVKEILLCLSSAVFLSLPFTKSNLWIFAWFGFVPLFFAIENKSGGRAFFLSYLTGVVFWLGTIYWLVHVTLLGLIFLSLYLALYFGLFGILISSYALSPITYNLFAIPPLWVMLEYLRGHLLTGFPWALLGYSQYQNLPIIQIADITGAYGVSFLVMMGNAFIYKVMSYELCLPAGKAGVMSKRQKTRILLTCCLLPSLLFISLGYGFYRLNSHDPCFRMGAPTHNSQLIKVSVIQANIPQELKWSPAAKEDIVKKYFHLTKEILQARPDLIIWPETAMQDYLIIDKQGYSNIDYLSNFVREVKVPLLLGVVAVENEGFYNSAVLFSKEGGILQRYDKLHLVPFGEYIPLRAVLPFLEAVVPIGDFTAGREYTIFNLPLTPYPLPLSFSVLVCFEDVFPNLARDFVKNGAQFLVNITNDAWFGDTSEPYQHLSASVFRAVENRVSVLRAANTGVSCFISPQGKIKTYVADKKGKETFIDGHITGNIFITKVRSIYNKYGDVFVLLCFVVTACGIILKKSAIRLK